MDMMAVKSNMTKKGAVSKFSQTIKGWTLSEKRVVDSGSIVSPWKEVIVEEIP